jgi:hypothetical protein
MMPLVSTPFVLMAAKLSAGMSDPITATMQVFENVLAESDANVAAPPRILVSVRNGVRVVSKATVPNTVSNGLIGEDIRK